MRAFVRTPPARPPLAPTLLVAKLAAADARDSPSARQLRLLSRSGQNRGWDDLPSTRRRSSGRGMQSMPVYPTASAHEEAQSRGHACVLRSNRQFRCWLPL